jgi:hypothetical protein
MEASVMPRLPLLLMFFKLEASTKAAGCPSEDVGSPS